MWKPEIEEYVKLAKQIRKQTLDMVHRTGSGHIGTALSIVEILVALYFKCLNVYPEDPERTDRDRFILSKGHGCASLYATLTQKGFLSMEVLDGYALDGGTLEQHPTRDVNKGIEVSTGSLGHGLSIGCGMALSAKHDESKHRIFALMSDGEMDEGSVWEAVMFASHHKLDNLIAIVDYNKLQALGKTNEVLNLEPLAQKWDSFGWATQEIDGHNFEQIISTLGKIPFEQNKPSVIIAHTVKGKGISFMENKVLWHYRCPDEAEYTKALKELS